MMEHASNCFIWTGLTIIKEMAIFLSFSVHFSVFYQSPLEVKVLATIFALKLFLKHLFFCVSFDVTVPFKTVITLLTFNIILESLWLRTQFSIASSLVLVLISSCSRCLILSSSSSIESCWAVILIIPPRRSTLTIWGSILTPLESFSWINLYFLQSFLCINICMLLVYIVNDILTHITISSTTNKLVIACHRGHSMLPQATLSQNTVFTRR